MQELIVPVRLGQTVPPFELRTYDPTKDDFGTFSIANQVARKRWTILFFYPGDFTFVCATEFEALAELHDQFNHLGCDIFTVSTDSEFVHLAWRGAEKELSKVKYQMAADRSGYAARLFGVYDEHAGQALRGAFVINPEGQLINSEVAWYNLGRNIEELLRRLKACIYMAGKPNEVCPAKWKDTGDKTLVNPGAKMVGKVHEALQGDTVGKP